MVKNKPSENPLRTKFEAWFREEVIPSELIFIGKTVAGIDPHEALRLIDQWMDYIEGEFKEDCWEDSLTRINPKDLESMAKIHKGFSDSNTKKSHERRQEWTKYEPWMIAYFNRNPSHNLTDARSHCATYFKVSLTTIKRRTKGFKKPSA